MAFGLHRGRQQRRCGGGRTTLAAAGVGANLQHYNPLPDAAIAKEWNLPESWLLRAQMVIGGIEAPAGEKAFEPVENRLKVFGA